MNNSGLYESLYKAILEDGKKFSEHEGASDWIKTRIETLERVFNNKIFSKKEYKKEKKEASAAK